MSGEMVRASERSPAFPDQFELLPNVARHSQEGEIVPENMRRIAKLELRSMVAVNRSLQVVVVEQKGLELDVDVSAPTP